MSQVKAILNRPLDALFGGGLSLLILLPLMIFKGEWLDALRPTHIALFTILINYPHFAASFWLVYRSPEIIRRHPWAAVRVPALLFGLCLLALAISPRFHAGVNLIFLASVVYLAWHYTGQAWGMMASFAALEGAPFNPDERALLRGSIRLLLVWHVVWALFIQRDFPALAVRMNWAYTVGLALPPLAAAVGAVGFLRWSRRLGRIPPIRVMVPWLAILCWYAAMAFHPRALHLVQIGHSLQYLPFPMRVEMNREAAKPSASPLRILGIATLAFAASTLLLYLLPQLVHGFDMRWWITPGLVAVTGISLLLLLLALGTMLWPKPWSPDPRTFLWGIAMLQGGSLLFWLAPTLLTRTSAYLPGGSVMAADAANLLVAFLNIHHYFTDSVAWKISTVEVRRELFAHLAPAATEPEPT